MICFATENILFSWKTEIFYQKETFPDRKVDLIEKSYALLEKIHINPSLLLPQQGDVSEKTVSAEKSTDHLVCWFSYQIRQRMARDKSSEGFIANLPAKDTETFLLLEKFIPTMFISKSTIVPLLHLIKLITTELFSKGQVVNLDPADCDFGNKVEVLLIAEVSLTFCSELDVSASVIFR